MNTKIKKSLLASSVVALSACSAITPTYETQEAYIVIDGQGNPNNQQTEKLLTDITTAVKSNVSSVRAARNIPPMQLPKEPGNFELKEPFAGSNFGALMQAKGQNLRVPNCQQPIMVLNSDDTSMARYGENARIFVCVMPFATGYRTAVYAGYSRATGGLSAEVLGATIARQLVGDASQFIPRTINDVKKSVEANLQSVKVVHSYIPESFAGPMVDQRSGLQSKN